MITKKIAIESQIYPANIIEQAVLDFGDIATIQFSQWTLIMEWSSEAELEEIFGEFMNYSLSLL